MSKPSTAYLFLGPEEGLKLDEISGLRKRLLHQLGEEPEGHRFHLPEDPLDTIVDTLRNGSLFSAHRLVTVSGAENLKKKADVRAIVEYLKSPNPDSTLVLLSDTVRIDAGIEKSIPGQNRKVFWEMFENQKSSWVVGYFRKRHIEISPEAVDLLLEIVENNTQELRNEAEKLCTFVGPNGSVDADEIDTFIYHSREESVFTLFSHITSNNFEAALQAVEKLRSSGEAGPIQIIGGLLFQIRRLLALRQLLDNDVNIDTAFSRLNIRGKRIQAEYRNGVSKYSASELESTIHLLAEYDALFRSERPGIHACLADLMIYQLLYSSTRLVNPPDPLADPSHIGESREEISLIR